MRCVLFPRVSGQFPSASRPCVECLSLHRVATPSVKLAQMSGTRTAPMNMMHLSACNRPAMARTRGPHQGNCDNSRAGSHHAATPRREDLSHVRNIVRGDPGISVNCPYGAPLTYARTHAETHFYWCPRRGVLPVSKLRAHYTRQEHLHD